MATSYSFCSALRPVASGSNGATVAPLPSLRLLLAYRNYYTIHGSPYTSAHVLIEKKNLKISIVQNGQDSRMVLCCQNRVSKGTNQCYGLHSSASSSVHSASVTVLGLLKKKTTKKKKKESVQNSVFAVFRLAT